MSGTAVQALTTTQIGQMTSMQIGALSSTGVGALSSTQIGALSSTQVRGLASTQMSLFPGTLSFNGTRLAALSEAQVRGLRATQVSNLDSAAVGALTTTQMRGLTGTQLAGLTSTDTGELAATQLAALTPQQLNAMGSTNIGALTTTQIGALSGAQLGGLLTASLSALDATRMGALTTPQLAGITASQMAALSTTDVGELSSTQIGALSTTRVSGLTATHTGALTALRIGGFTVSQIGVPSTTNIRARILQASTSAICGDPEVHPQPEAYAGHVNPIGPRSCYDEGKRCAETPFFDDHRQHGVDIRVARIFNTCGLRVPPNDGRVVSNFTVQARTNRPITLHGDGSQTRSFCDVDDLVDWLIRLMESDGAAALPVNLGNPEEYTVRALAEEVLAIAGGGARLIHRPLPQDDPRQRRPDIGRARALLHRAPTIGLREGRERTVTYFRRHANRWGRGVPAAA